MTYGWCQNLRDKHHTSFTSFCFVSQLFILSHWGKHQPTYNLEGPERAGIYPNIFAVGKHLITIAHLHLAPMSSLCTYSFIRHSLLISMTIKPIALPWVMLFYLFMWNNKCHVMNLIYVIVSYISPNIEPHWCAASVMPAWKAMEPITNSIVEKNAVSFNNVWHTPGNSIFMIRNIGMARLDCFISKLQTLAVKICKSERHCDSLGWYVSTASS